jgi:hypothetical protein
MIDLIKTRIFIYPKSLSVFRAFRDSNCSYIKKGLMMKAMQKSIMFFMIFIAAPQCLLAADIVPFSIKRIKSISTDYVELIGPGEIQVNNEAIPYKGTKYIRKTSIGTMTSVTGTTRGCILTYSSENYTENISVLNQSCDEILYIINAIK